MRKVSTMASTALTDAETARLIKLYQSQENLFNINSRLYHNRDHQRDSLRYLCTAMDKDWTEEQMKAKLKSLRTQYTKHLGKIRESEGGGTSTDSVYKPTWKFFRSLDAFLRPYCITRKGIISNMLDQADQTEGAEDINLLLSQTESQQAVASCDDLPMDEESTTVSPSPVLPTDEPPRHRAASSPQFVQATKKRKKDFSSEALGLMRNFSSEALGLLREVTDSTRKKSRKEKSTADAFGEYVAMKVKELPPEKRAPAEKKILDVLWEFHSDTSS